VNVYGRAAVLLLDFSGAAHRQEDCIRFPAFLDIDNTDICAKPA
jgi:hypothetical protein